MNDPVQAWTIYRATALRRGLAEAQWNELMVPSVDPEEEK
jgi:hypothetical protein